MDDETQLEAVAALVRRVLGEDVRGIYLHGSTGAGRRTATSDTDVLVVTDRPMTGRQRRTLVAGLLPISGARAAGSPARPVELTVVALGDVRPWRYPPQEDFLYGEWERDGYESGSLPARRPNPDLAVIVTMVLAADRPLTGPPPRTLLDPVPRGDLVLAAVDAVPGLLSDLEDDTRNVLLTLARAWLTVATGTIGSKDVAAAWALERLPASLRPALARARDGYLAGTYPDFRRSGPAVQPTAEAIASRIRDAARATPPA